MIRGRWRRCEAADDTGASSVEMVLYTPLLMFVFFVVVQGALSWYGQDVATTAAREAARVARVQGGTPEALEAARDRGVQYAEQVGGEGLQQVEVEVELVEPGIVRATVTGRSVEIVSGLAPAVSASVQGPVETFRADE